MFIKTSSQLETEVAVGLKNSLRKLGVEVHVIPHGVDYLFVSIDEFDGKNQINVKAYKEDTCEPLDTTIGFNSCAEAYSYAEKISFEAGLEEDSVFGDVWDPIEGVF